MQQGGCVDELDDRCQLVMMRPAIPERPRRKQDQSGAQALATALNDIFGNRLTNTTSE